MAGSREVRAGSAYVEILGKDGALRKTLDNAKKTLEKWGKGVDAVGKTLLKLGTVSLTPLAASSKIFASMGDELAKAATRTGASVEALSALKYAADQSGSSLEDLESGLRHMSKTIVGATKGSAEAKESLRSLGLTVEDLKGLSPDEQFVTIADALSQIQDPTLKAARAMEIFGKGGASLIPLMDGGAAGINDLVGQAQRLGLVWSTQDAKAAEEFGDRLDDLWKVVKKLTADVGAALVPIFRHLAVTLTDGLVAAGRWVQEHREIIQAALKVAVGLVTAGAAFYGIAKAMTAVGFILGGISIGLGVLGGILGAIIPAATIAGITAIAVALGAIGTAAAQGIAQTGWWKAGIELAGKAFAGLKGIVSSVWAKLLDGVPLIRGLGDVFGQVATFFKDTWREAGAFLKQTFTSMVQTATTAWGGIVDAFNAGDLKLAVQILWVGLQAEFQQGVAALKTIWANFKKTFLEFAYGAFYGAQAAWEIVQHSVTNAWIDLAATGKKIWAELAAGFADVWESTINATEKGIHYLSNALGVTSDEELAAALKLADQQSAANKRQIEGDRKAAREKAKADQDAAHAIEDKQNTANLAKIGTDFNADLKKIQDELAKGVDRSRGDALQKELNALRAKARDEAKGKLAAGSQFDVFSALGIPTPDALADFMRKQAGGGIGEISRQLTTNGTFNSAAVGTLSGGSSIPQQQLDIQRRIEKNTRAPRVPGIPVTD